MRRLLTACLVLLVVGLSQPEARTSASIPSLASINRALDEGRIGLDEWAVLTATAIKAPEELPDRYSAPLVSGSPTPSPCPTVALRDVAVSWDEYQPSTQLALAALFARPNLPYDFASPSGFFKLHFEIDPDSSHAVPGADDDSSGVPDFIEKMAAYLDSARTSHLDQGYLMPPADGTAGGDSLYDVYFDSLTYYGVTTTDGVGPYPWNDQKSYIVLHSTFLGFAPNDDPEGDQWGAAKATAAHEFHHAVQYAYDYTEPGWYLELDAVAIEDLIFDASNDNYNYLDEFFPYPERSLQEWSIHAYASFTFGLFLAQKYDTTLLRAVWEGVRYSDTILGTLQDTLTGRYGWSRDSAFGEYVLWNYCTGSRDDGNHHEEAASYPEVAIGRTHTSYPVVTTNSPTNPAGYGATYVEFYPDGELGTLEISFNGSDSRDWRVYLIKSTAASVHVFESVPVTLPSQLADVSVSNFELYHHVTLVGVNITPSSSSAAFSYSAELIAPREITVQAQPFDSAVYAGNYRTLEVLVGNPSPLNDVYHLISDDDLGWVVDDSLLVPVVAGTDTIVGVEIHPPQGTALETVSEIRFLGRSNGDPQVQAEDTLSAKVVLYRGDMNWDGAIDIADVVYMASYFFQQGPEPLPILLSADHDCSGELDIADVVYFVTWLFQNGSPCPCNPYLP